MRSPHLPRTSPLISLVIALFLSPLVARATDLGSQTTTLWAPFLEWALTCDAYTGNPFDLPASVTFTHAASGESRTTDMFYAGESTWKFRFTGTHTGQWTFLTTSPSSQLDHLSGTILVTPNPNPEIKGFLTHSGNRFAIQQNNANDLHAYLFDVYMNAHIADYKDVAALANPALTTRLLDNAQDNGFEIVFQIINHNWLKLGCLAHSQHDSVNPDLQTFQILDDIITQAHARGMRWHFWAWGDEARKWTPIGLPGGVNGPVDRRLQRYIAARLGPLPGWTMGYGFDLAEWTSPEGRNGWASYLHQHMGWDHLLCSRGFPIEGSNNNLVSYSGFGGNRDLSTTPHGPANFAEVVANITAYPMTPSFYEERHSYLREQFQLDMDGSRRLRWWQAMAGGLGGFFGFYSSSPHPYPHPEQFQTFQTFWESRFALDLIHKTDPTPIACLHSPDQDRIILYAEDTDTITCHLTPTQTTPNIVAVDTRRPYQELILPPIHSKTPTLQLPHTSDWAIAIGTFPTSPTQPSTTPTPGKSTHPLVHNGWYTQQDGRIIWGWVQHNGWWRPGQRANLTRHAIGHPKGEFGPNRTEDLHQLTDSMLQFGYPGFEHNFGLWFDRRRDAHDTEKRPDPNVVPPFLEQPWARALNDGPAWDGLPKYNLEQFNPWYFARLKAFADLCDAKGTVLFHKFYMQHALLETPAHYVDFPWRPANCVQDTAMPDSIPAANAFYDVSNPERRRLHQAYIRHCLDTLGDNRNVVHLVSQEFTGPREFVEFWIDTISEWEQKTGKKVHIGLGATKDVQDAILADPIRGQTIGTIDMRCWWPRTDGSLFAPAGGTELPGRGLEDGSTQAEECTPEMIYSKVRKMRDQFPGRALLDAINANRQQSWAFLMAGGGMLVRGQISYPDYADPETYIQPADMDIILPTYQFIRKSIAEQLTTMRPSDLVRNTPPDVWSLADPAQHTILVYSLNGKPFHLDLRTIPAEINAQWINPRSGETTPAFHDPVPSSTPLSFTPPTPEDWALWISGK